MGGLLFYEGELRWGGLGERGGDEELGEFGVKGHEHGSKF